MKGDEGVQCSKFEAIFSVMGKKCLPEVLVTQGAIQIDEGGDVIFCVDHPQLLNKPI